MACMYEIYFIRDNVMACTFANGRVRVKNSLEDYSRSSEEVSSLLKCFRHGLDTKMELENMKLWSIRQRTVKRWLWKGLKCVSRVSTQLDESRIPKEQKWKFVKRSDFRTWRDQGPDLGMWRSNPEVGFGPSLRTLKDWGLATGSWMADRFPYKPPGPSGVW